MNWFPVLSTDDDIDESELEQLAGLMEAEAAEQDGVPENSFQDGVQLQDEVGVDSEEAGLPEQGVGQIEPEAGLPEEEAGHPEEKAGQLDEEAGQLKDAGMVEDAAEEEEDESDDENAMGEGKWGYPFLYSINPLTPVQNCQHFTHSMCKMILLI